MKPRDLLVILGPDDHHRAADLPAHVDRVHAVRSVFPDGEQLLTVPHPETIRGRHVLIAQTTAPSQDVRLMSACQLTSIAAASGAASATCFLPYLGYQRQDRVAEPGQALSGSLVLRLIRSAGAHTVLTVDRHSTPHWDGGPGLPVVVSLSSAEPAAAVLEGPFDYVVATDRGGSGRAARIGEALGVPTVALSKLKSAARGTYYETLPERLRDRRLLVVDDVCTSGSTIRPLCADLAAMGARITVFITHVVPTANGRITAMDGVDRLLSSDSCGDASAPVRLMPSAVEYWISSLTPRAAPAGGPGLAAARGAADEKGAR
ncbi:ribose-phosphate pyrophosphokinase-like domain-containing protein [Streptomyces puniciscabiei]